MFFLEHTYILQQRERTTHAIHHQLGSLFSRPRYYRVRTAPGVTPPPGPAAAPDQLREGGFNLVRCVVELIPLRSEGRVFLPQCWYSLF